MTVGRRTHYCDGPGSPEVKVFGRIVNLYVHRKGRWVKVGTICSNCGNHWINGNAYTVQHPRKKTA